ncbi:MAG TPA: PAS domain-containing protein [Candidatus Dormibacteraeota bacterium]|nr:PAS domain-containing protein [Candidatus Dormibacteraeota bacterium]
MPSHHSTRTRLVVIPTSDTAFAQIAERLLDDRDAKSAAALQARLRSVFPRAVVRPRDIAGDAPAWYVYRDGRWRSDHDAPWWQEPGLPRLTVTPDGWLADGNRTALGLLGIDRVELGMHHFTDFVTPGTLTDALTVFDIVQHGNDLTATILLRPMSGHVVAVDLHAWRDGDDIRAVMRLADDIEPAAPQVTFDVPPLRCRPERDVAFREYAARSLSRMPEPTPEGLAMRLRRLYPRAEVTAADDHWLVVREPTDIAASAGWWTAPALAKVRYDAQALILEASPEAGALFGRELVGHYWQEFVIPGSVEQVSAMLSILAEVGRAESRFRMPRADGSLVEFDSYTEVDGETYVTVMREADEGKSPS